MLPTIISQEHKKNKNLPLSKNAMQDLRSAIGQISWLTGTVI